MRNHLVGAWQRVRRLPWGRIALGTIAVVVLIAVVPPFRRAAALAGSRVILFVASPLAPSIGGFDDLPVPTRIMAADGSLLAALECGQRRDPITLDALPEHVPRAVLAAEDKNFYDHDGVDPSAVFRALVRNVQGDSQGGSTITQQLAKINYTGGERTFLRKFREVLYATRLEREYSKDELLQRYLNQVYFGERSFGIAAAAKTFFGVEPQELTVAQAATLAGKIRSPEALDPRTDLRRVQRRRDAVLRNMRDNGWISAEQLEEALVTPIQLAPPTSDVADINRAPHFVDHVVAEASSLVELGGTVDARRNRVYCGGFTVQSTLDPKAQQAAVAAVQARLAAPTDPATAVASVQPGDGAIRALVSGLDPARKFNLATQGLRQPGSAFKPFAYLAALGAGIDPRSEIDASSPKELVYRGEPITINNYEGEGEGLSTIEEGLVRSINTVFAELTLEVGPSNVAGAAHRAGIGDQIDEDRNRLSPMALGGLTTGVTPVEMASAYAAFAARGTYAAPYAVAAVADREGREVYRHGPVTHRALEEREVGVLNAALMGVIQRGTGRSASIGRPAAGKTGTTQEHADAWFVGFVPQLSTAVWVGHPDERQPMLNVHGRRVSGGSFPAEIWGDMMRTTMAGVPVEPIFTASPDGLGLRLINTTTTTSTTTTLPPPPPPPEVAPPPPPPPLPGQHRPPSTSPPRRPATTTTSTSTTTTTRPRSGGARDAGSDATPPDD